MVLVLDNFEHVLDAADEVAAVVHASPASRVIVTSRAPLRIAGEHEVPVAPLVDDAADAVRRPGAGRPVGLGPGSGTADVVAEICHLLDDLPLGIELAAARVSTLPPTVIRDRLAARLPLPGSGSSRRARPPADVGRGRRLEPRPPAARTGRRCSISWACSRAASISSRSNAVAGPSALPTAIDLDELLELAEQSLIVAAPTVPGRARFRMLRTIQSFALDRLAADGLETRHPPTPRRGLSGACDRGRPTARHIA